MPTNPGQELCSINFGAMIGGPLVAVIEAQTLAAPETADWIKSVGLNKTTSQFMWISSTPRRSHLISHTFRLRLPVLP